MRRGLPHNYVDSIKKRSLFRFLVGLLPRFWNFFKAYIIISLARMKGAVIGKNCFIPLKLALRANSNLHLQDHVIIETYNLDLREKISIGSSVIINKEVTILRQSHDVDDSRFRTTGSSLIIHDYSWIGTKSMILPGCTVVKYGCVLGAGSVLAKDTPSEMIIMVGNPARPARNRLNVPSELIVEALQGRDFNTYLRARLQPFNEIK